MDRSKRVQKSICSIDKKDSVEISGGGDQTPTHIEGWLLTSVTSLGENCATLAIF